MMVFAASITYSEEWNDYSLRVEFNIIGGNTTAFCSMHQSLLGVSTRIKQEACDNEWFLMLRRFKLEFKFRHKLECFTIKRKGGDFQEDGKRKRRSSAEQKNNQFHIQTSARNLPCLHITTPIPPSLRMPQQGPTGVGKESKLSKEGGGKTSEAASRRVAHSSWLTSRPNCSSTKK